MTQQHRSFTYIPPTHISPITCPYCGGMAPLTRCSPRPVQKGDLRTFECRDCGKTSTVSVPDLAGSVGSQGKQYIGCAPPTTPPEPLASRVICPKCKREMALVGIESEHENRELYTFECEDCELLEVRGVRIK
jgi:transcription elongation factor Elf1